MFDAWAQCGEGKWDSSKFLLSIRSRHTSKVRGTRKWLMVKDMNEAFGEDVAEKMRTRKLTDGHVGQDRGAVAPRSA